MAVVPAMTSLHFVEFRCWVASVCGRSVCLSHNTREAIRMATQSPPGWMLSRLISAGAAISAVAPQNAGLVGPDLTTELRINRIGVADLRAALSSGWADFSASRTDVVFLCVFYPLVGLILGRLFSGAELLPLLFPLASGFALVGPLAGVGLNEMSRRREQGRPVSWTDAFDVLRSPSFGAIFLLGVVLAGILGIWLATAGLIYNVTMGPDLPASGAQFVSDVVTTDAGRAMIVIGVFVGFLFANVAFAISVVSFPLLLDRPVGLSVAVATSIRAVWANPIVMGMWALTIAALLVIGSLPLFLGLIVVMPVLGHATWHLYRRVVVH